MGDGNDVIEDKLDTESDNIVIQANGSAFDMRNIALSQLPGQVDFTADDNAFIDSLTYDSVNKTLAMHLLTPGVNALGGINMSIDAKCVWIKQA